MLTCITDRFHISLLYIVQGAFNDYVDKIRWIGGQKMSIFTTLSVKNAHVEVGRWSKGKIVST